ncbi:hypothetical protein AAVH_02222 [Aphelenchoides avenae]|nr:hypothetical protein AAVH_02222 [Aphelenchus avenae]
MTFSFARLIPLLPQATRTTGGDVWSGIGKRSIRCFAVFAGRTLAIYATITMLNGLHDAFGMNLSNEARECLTCVAGFFGGEAGAAVLTKLLTRPPRGEHAVMTV